MKGKREREVVVHESERGLCKTNKTKGCVTKRVEGRNGNDRKDDPYRVEV